MTVEQHPPSNHQAFQPAQHPSGPLPVPGPYAMPVHPAAYVVPTSGLAVASLVCSLVGLITFGLGSIPGVICGHMALNETRNGSRGGHGLAIAGLIIGWIQCGGWALFWAFTFFSAILGAGAA